MADNLIYLYSRGQQEKLFLRILSKLAISYNRLSGYEFFNVYIYSSSFPIRWQDFTPNFAFTPQMFIQIAMHTFSTNLITTFSESNRFIKISWLLLKSSYGRRSGERTDSHPNFDLFHHSEQLYVYMYIALYLSRLIYKYITIHSDVNL